MSTRNVVISDGNTIDQAERDRLPDHQDAYGAGARQIVRRGLDWRPMLALILIGGAVALYLAVRFVEWLSHVNDETAWLDVYLVAGLKIGLFVAPIVFLVLPRATPTEAAPKPHAEPESVPMGATTAESRVGAMGLVKQEKATGSAEALPKSFPRGEFTFNKRFFETQFPSFFRVVPSDTDRDLVIDIAAGRGSAVATRISRITANELHVKNQVGKEVPVNFADITGVTLRHKDQKT